jgi:hypothetical protein
MWPWGANTDPSLCNLDQSTRGCGLGGGFSCGPLPAPSLPRCKNAAGISDLIGNVREWVGVCDARALEAPDGPCWALGGSYDDALDNLGCHRLGPSFSKSARRPDLGFRCCHELSAPDRLKAGL